MNSTSSRILREEEHAVIQPVWWREIAAVTAHHGPQQTGTKQDDSADRDQEIAQLIERERERIAQEAYQRGLNEGIAAGREQAKGEIQPVLERMGRTLADLSSLRARIRKDAEGDLLKLSISIARRVLHRELTLDPESIEGLIRIALEKLQSRDLCRIRVHPDQAPAIRASLERFPNSQKAEIITDPSMQCGDVLFETAHGNIDASIEAQLREIERGFADRLGR